MWNYILTGMFQVSALCNGVSGSVSPYVTLDSSNDTDVNAQYHDFRAFTADSRPDWYFESMTQMRWNSRVGYVGYTPKELKNMANTGSSVGIIDDLVTVARVLGHDPWQKRNFEIVKLMGESLNCDGQ